MTRNEYTEAMTAQGITVGLIEQMGNGWFHYAAHWRDGTFLGNVVLCETGDHVTTFIGARESDALQDAMRLLTK